MIVLIFSIFYSCNGITEGTEMIEVDSNHIKFGGIIYPNRYNSRKDRANGHHFIVFSGGGNARKALIESTVSDVDILGKLKEVGAVSGNNLSEASWTKRNDLESPAADQRVEGSKIRITIEWDHIEHEVSEMIENSTQSDFDIRVGGHADLIPVWRSGCVTCLFSCPGGRTSNHVYTIRDQAFDRKSFRAREEILPKDGTPVKIYFYLIQS